MLSIFLLYQNLSEFSNKFFYTFDDGVLYLNTCIGKEISFDSSHHQKVNVEIFSSLLAVIIVITYTYVRKI